MDSDVMDSATNIVENNFDLEGEEGEVVENEQTGEEAVQEEKQPEKKKYKIKVDQKEEELELSEEELIKELQKSRSATQRFQKASEVLKNTEALIGKLTEDPITILEKLGVSDEALINKVMEKYNDKVLSVAEQKLIERLERELMPQEQREVYDIKKEHAILKQEREERLAREQEMQEEMQFRETVENQKQAIKQNMEAAIKAAGIEPSKELKEEIIKISQYLIKKGQQATWQQIVDAAHSKIKTTQESLLKKLDTKELIKVLGKEKLDEIRKMEVEAFKNNSIKKNSLVSNNNGEPRRKKSTHESLSEVNERIYQLFGHE